jgi:predicted phage baseplate assembly protein
VPDNRLPPSTAQQIQGPTEVFTLDPGSGRISFGDGLHGRRPEAGAQLLAQYDFCQGAAGNVAAGTITTAPALPSGLTVANPVRTWGGSDAETVDEGEKQVPRMLQHRDRLVSAADFISIAWRTPGIDLGRVEVLGAFHPDLGSDPGSAPGVVTLMAIPRMDPAQPDAPQADRIFLNTLCTYLDPRRLVTTELILRGPVYKGIWISVGLDVASGFAIADVTEAVKQRLRAFLSPLPPPDALESGFATQATPLLATNPLPSVPNGWPLRTAVSSRVLLAEAARVPGVTSVADVLLAEGVLGPTDVVEMTGLELPRILGVSVVSGDPVQISSLRGDSGQAAPSGVTTTLLPVPVIPASCQ